MKAAIMDGKRFELGDIVINTWNNKIGIIHSVVWVLDRDLNKYRPSSYGVFYNDNDIQLEIYSDLRRPNIIEKFKMFMFKIQNRFVN